MQIDENNIFINPNQPTINIGMIGSVSNGKSSTTRAISQKKTQQHSKELERDITIKLGYANAKIWCCQRCPKPQCFQSTGSDVMTRTCNICFEPMILKKHVSFVDCPGHNSLMATMLNGTCVMNGSIIIESGSNINSNTDDFPAIQTRDHIDAIKSMNLPINMACLNKLDLIDKQQAENGINKLNKYLEDRNIQVPIIPIVANFNINIDVLLEYICNIPEPVFTSEDLNKNNLKMIIVRSFDINKPGKTIKNLCGGVVGGTIMKGSLSIGDEILLLPGFLSSNKDKKSTNKWFYTPVKSRVLSLKSETNTLNVANPGGLVGVNLDIDPGLTGNDKLVGSVMINEKCIDKYHICETFFVVFEYFGEKSEKKLEKDQKIILNYNANNIPATIERVKKNKAQIAILKYPICVVLNDNITISKMVKNNLTIMAKGVIIETQDSIKK